ncbi:MAG: hypothetical protein ABI222_11400 [Opitutaceae bacterium]
MNAIRYLRFFGLAIALGAAAGTAAGQSSTVPSQATSLSNLGDLLDRLPNFPSFGLPGFMPKDVFQIYSSPHFGDLLHRDYMRVPLGLRAKIDDEFQAHVEVEGYFTHGLADSAGYGLDRLETGIKWEQSRAEPGAMDLHMSSGLDFITPLGRPPRDLTDGYRHTVPYVAFSKLLVPDHDLIGYSTLGIDLLSSTPLPSNFGRNQLHSDSFTVSGGFSRQWKTFQTLMTASYSSTVLFSNESHQVFGLRPAVVFPLTRWQGRHTRLTATVGGWSIWGPDGHEIGASGSVRVEFNYKSRQAKP